MKSITILIVFLLRSEELPKDLTSKATSHDLARGDTLYRQGEPVEAVFALVSGRLQLSASTSDGRQIALYTVRPGECVAEAELFSQTYCGDAVAEIRSCVRAFPVRTLRDTLRKRPDLAAEFMELQANRCYSLRVSLELRSLRSARQRILQYVKLSAPPGSKTVLLDRTLRNVADDLGLTHETFYRTLTQLIEEGALTRTKNSLQLTQSGPKSEPALDA